MTTLEQGADHASRWFLHRFPGRDKAAAILRDVCYDGLQRLRLAEARIADLERKVVALQRERDAAEIRVARILRVVDGIADLPAVPTRESQEV